MNREAYHVCRIDRDREQWNVHGEKGQVLGRGRSREKREIWGTSKKRDSLTNCETHHACRIARDREQWNVRREKERALGRVEDGKADRKRSGKSGDR
jgi:hypothetical protein